MSTVEASDVAIADAAGAQAQDLVVCVAALEVLSALREGQAALANNLELLMQSVEH